MLVPALAPLLLLLVAPPLAVEPGLLLLPEGFGEGRAVNRCCGWPPAALSLSPPVLAHGRRGFVPAELLRFLTVALLLELLALLELLLEVLEVPELLALGE